MSPTASRIASVIASDRRVPLSSGLASLRAIALASAILAATSAAAPAEPFRILPAAASAEASRAARFESMPVRQAQNGARYGGGFIAFLLSGGGGAMATYAPAQGSAYAPMLPEADARGAAVDPRFDRQIVPYEGAEKPGTVIIDTPERLLYLIEPGGKALRYGIGVGRPGFTWAGVKYVSMKREWPDWRPPEEMLQRRPDLPHFMTGGPDNPLGARALYLFVDNKDTLIRIHGTNEPSEIGGHVSSGCIRMRDMDAIDLYGRVHVGTPVVVIG
jgi:lipoprotein-anchoring transpeptidase ErfK/SrfK